MERAPVRRQSNKGAMIAGLVVAALAYNEGSVSCQAVRFKGSGTEEARFYSYATNDQYINMIADRITLLGIDKIFHLVS